MEKHRLKFSFIALTFLAAVSTTHGAEKESGGDATESVLKYDRSPSAVVIEMRFTDLPGSVPTLQIYGDGTAVVTHPQHTHNRGVYERRLAESEMKDLLRYLDLCGVMGFDEREIAKRVREITD